jgi:hypothetical protein
MKGIEWHASFVPRRAPADTSGVPAVTLQAGEQWLGEWTLALSRFVPRIQIKLIESGYRCVSRRGETGSVGCRRISTDSRGSRRVFTWRRPFAICTLLRSCS